MQVWNISIMSGGLKNFGCPGHQDTCSQTFCNDLGSFPSGCGMQHVEKDCCRRYKDGSFVVPTRTELTVYSRPNLGTSNTSSWIILCCEGLSCAPYGV